MSRRRMALLAAVVLTAALAAAAVVLVASGRGSTVTPEAFLAQVHDVCTEYGERLDEISPPTDLSSPGAVYESIAAALPILRAQEAEAQALRRPPSLRDDLDEFFALTDRSIEELQTAFEAAGERALFPMATALSRFEEVRDEAKAVARRIGFDC